MTSEQNEPTNLYKYPSDDITATTPRSSLRSWPSGSSMQSDSNSVDSCDIDLDTSPSPLKNNRRRGKRLYSVHRTSSGAYDTYKPRSRRGSQLPANVSSTVAEKAVSRFAKDEFDRPPPTETAQSQKPIKVDDNHNRVFTIYLKESDKSLMMVSVDSKWHDVLEKVCRKRSLDLANHRLVACDVEFRELEGDQCVADTNYRELRLVYCTEGRECCANVAALRSTVYACQRMVEDLAALEDNHIFFNLPGGPSFDSHKLFRGTGCMFSHFVDIHAFQAKQAISMLSCVSSLIVHILREGVAFVTMEDLAGFITSTNPLLVGLAIGVGSLYLDAEKEQTEQTFSEYKILVNSIVSLHVLFTQHADGALDASDPATEDKISDVSKITGSTLQHLRALIDRRQAQIGTPNIRLLAFDGPYYGQSSEPQDLEHGGVEAVVFEGDLHNIPSRFKQVSTKKRRERKSLAELGSDAILFLKNPNESIRGQSKRNNTDLTSMVVACTEKKRKDFIMNNLDDKQTGYRKAVKELERANFGLVETHLGGGKLFEDAYDPRVIAEWAQTSPCMPEIAPPFQAKVHTASGSGSSTPEGSPYQKKKKRGGNVIRHTWSRVKWATIRGPLKKPDAF